MFREIKVHKVCKGKAEGEAIVTSQPISFYGGLDPKTGVIVDPTHELAGHSVEGKILVFPKGKGSTAGSFIIYAAKKRGKAPAAMVAQVAEAIIAGGALISDIPLVDQLDEDPLQVIKTGDYIIVDADQGSVKIKS